MKFQERRGHPTLAGTNKTIFFLGHALMISDQSGEDLVRFIHIINLY